MEEILGELVLLAGRGELLQLSLLGEGFVQRDLAPAGRYLFAELRMIGGGGKFQPCAVPADGKVNSQSASLPSDPLVLDQAVALLLLRAQSACSGVSRGLELCKKER